MDFKRTLFVLMEMLALWCVALGQSSVLPSPSSPTPVRILKQINRQNEDGSYTYGYQNEDGSYKIETKNANGEIVGKYGYVDVEGKPREIEYGASHRGFEPVGPGITVPPPTIHLKNEYANGNNNVETDYDDGQYREDPSIYDKTETSIPKFVTAAPVAKQRQQQQQQQPQQPQQPVAQSANFVYETSLNGEPPRYQWYRQPQYNVAAASPFHGLPAGNIDPYSGSYTINYAG